MGWPTSRVKRAEKVERPSPTRCPRSARVQGRSGCSWIELKRRSDMRVRHRAQPSAFPGTQRPDPASQHLDEEYFGQPGERDALAGTLDRRFARHAPRINPSQSRSGAGFSRSTGGSSSSTLPREGRDTVKLPQIIFASGCALPP
jgi:hypothetical protein